MVNFSCKMGRVCPLLGPKMSAFCIVMSIWGIIFLGLLGLFFKLEAVTLFPDLGFKEEEHKAGAAEAPPAQDEASEAKPSREDIQQRYGDKALQCWIAAGLYAITLLVVFWQNKYNRQPIF